MYENVPIYIKRLMDEMSMPPGFRQGRRFSPGHYVYFTDDAPRKLAPAVRRHHARPRESVKLVEQINWYVERKAQLDQPPEVVTEKLRIEIPSRKLYNRSDPYRLVRKSFSKGIAAAAENKVFLKDIVHKHAADVYFSEKKGYRVVLISQRNMVRLFSAFYDIIGFRYDVDKLKKLYGYSVSGLRMYKYTDVLDKMERAAEKKGFFIFKDKGEQFYYNDQFTEGEEKK